MTQLILSTNILKRQHILNFDSERCDKIVSNAQKLYQRVPRTHSNLQSIRGVISMTLFLPLTTMITSVPTTFQKVPTTYIRRYILSRYGWRETVGATLGKWNPFQFTSHRLVVHPSIFSPKVVQAGRVGTNNRSKLRFCWLPVVSQSSRVLPFQANGR